MCESDPLCDPAVLVAAPKPEPHIRNRRLSPGSGSCGGGGGGCGTGVDKQSNRPTSSNSSSESATHRTGHTQVFTSSLHREQRAYRAYRGSRQEGVGQGARAGEKALRSTQTHTQKERWVGDTLTSLKPPPAFPVKDSPAKLQPAVSYASKVKATGAAGGVVEEPPGIKVLLQNQWGLSFISDGPAAENAAPQDRSPTASPHPVAGEVATENSAPSSSASTHSQSPKEPGKCEDLLLSCHHLAEAVEYHTQGILMCLHGSVKLFSCFSC